MYSATVDEADAVGARVAAPLKGAAGARHRLLHHQFDLVALPERALLRLRREHGGQGAAVVHHLHGVRPHGNDARRGRRHHAQVHVAARDARVLDAPRAGVLSRVPPQRHRREPHLLPAVLDPARGERHQHHVSNEALAPRRADPLEGEGRVLLQAMRPVVVHDAQRPHRVYVAALDLRPKGRHFGLVHHHLLPRVRLGAADGAALHEALERVAQLHGR
eukprot:scaffold52816_cov59-Phaeocystis_antarctica.AAC.9